MKEDTLHRRKVKSKVIEGFILFPIILVALYLPFDTSLKVDVPDALLPLLNLAIPVAMAIILAIYIYLYSIKNFKEHILIKLFKVHKAIMYAVAFAYPAIVFVGFKKMYPELVNTQLYFLPFLTLLFTNMSVNLYQNKILPKLKSVLKESDNK